MRLKDQYITRPMWDKQVAVSTGEELGFNGAVMMNRTAAVIFELLKEETTEAAIVEAMCKRFDVPRETIERDVRECVGTFRARGLITED